MLSMALSSKVFFSATNSPIPINRNSEINNSNRFFPSTSLPMIPRCSIAHDHNIVLTPIDHFDYRSGHPMITDEFLSEHRNKLEAFKRIFREGGEDPVEGLAMVDAIQRLGIDHHFQYEIEKVLKKQYMLSGINGGHDNDLYEVSLRFRLLRQEGYFVPAGVFNRFKGMKGSFRHELGGDIKGLMELYEASQLGIDGEDILDEAREFSSQTLQKWGTAEVDHFLRKPIRNTLDQPYHKSLSRFTARNLLTNFHGTNRWIDILQELAKMDFSIVQSLHQTEIVRISNWWRDLGLAKELEFARDQPLKWYIWSMACLTDPSLSEQRIDLTKPISMIYIIDDIFDVYGTLDELTLFTEAVDRWDYAAAAPLPDYMKISFKALHNITDEISHKVYRKHGWNPEHSLRKAVRRLKILLHVSLFYDVTTPRVPRAHFQGAFFSKINII
ncbi:hypothetical protein DITRI_Ditri02bG0021100 [Diplodiscus trichospermus]